MAELKRQGRRLSIACVAALLAAFGGVSLGKVYQAGPDDYRSQLGQLEAGDQLVLEPGSYTDGLPVHGLRGLNEQPIIIAGPDSGGEAVFYGRSGHNTVSIKDSAFVTIRNLVLDGNGLMVDAVKAEGTSRFAHDILLEGLRITGHDGHQQIVGISTKCPAWNWTIRNVVIDGAGTGMYFGNSDGTAPFIAGLIERNVVRNTTGYALQVKHQTSRPSIPGIPEDQRVTVIRDNLFDKSHGGADGNYARPSVLVGHWPEMGPGEFDRYLIYRNLFYQNPTEALFQGTGRLAFYDNLLVNTSGVGRGAMIMSHQGGVPKVIDVFQNTIVTSDIGIAIWDAAPDGRQWVAANAVYAGTPITGGLDKAWNHTGAMAEASDALAAPGAPLGNGLDLSPLGDALQDSDIPSGALISYPGSGLDFRGEVRESGFAGAYGASVRDPLDAIGGGVTDRPRSGPSRPMPPHSLRVEQPYSQ